MSLPDFQFSGIHLRCGPKFVNRSGMFSLPDFQFSGIHPGEAETLGHHFAAGFSIIGHPPPVRPKFVNRSGTFSLPHFQLSGTQPGKAETPFSLPHFQFSGIHLRCGQSS
jgi:hypothetical protein